MALRSFGIALFCGTLFLVCGNLAAHDREDEPRGRLTAPDAAPFPDARGEVILNLEALVIRVQGLAPADYSVHLDDGSGTLVEIGTLTVAVEEDEKDDGEGDGVPDGEGHGEDGHEDGRDRDGVPDGVGGGEGDGVPDGEGDGVPDGEGEPDSPRGSGVFRLSGAELPFGATSPLDLAGRTLQVKDAAGAVVLQGKTPTPIAEEPEEQVGVCPLVRPEPPVDPDAAGEIKLESGGGRLVIKLHARALLPSAIYEITFTNPADGASEGIGALTAGEDGGGRFKLDSSKGDAIPFGAPDLQALVGFRVDLKDPEDRVILTGTVCPPRVREDGGGEHDGDGKGDPDGADEPCEANLERPDPAPDPDAKGEIEIEGQELEVEVENLAPGTAYDVALIDIPGGGVSQVVGQVRTGEHGLGQLELERVEGVPLPFGKASVADFAGFGVEVRDSSGAVVLKGVLPAILCEAEEEDRSDGHEGGGDGEPGEEEPRDDGRDLGAGAVAAGDAEPMFLMLGDFDAPFLRGDSNRDGKLDITDPVDVLLYLFSGGTRPYCLDASDANDDGRLDITDPIFLLGYLFLGGESPGDPGTMVPGSDRTADGLYCADAIGG